MPGTFLVVGAGPGIGLATARRFAREGFRIVLAARDPARVQALACDLRSASADAVAAPVDAANVEQLTHLIRNYASDLEVLHYNVAAMRTATIEEQPLETFAADIQVGITGALVAMKAALPSMAQRKSGTILLTGGSLALQPMPQLLTLSIGKIAIRSMAQMLFEPIRKKGVHLATVTVGKTIAPGSPEAEAVAALFWKLHSQSPDAWAWEETYR